MKQILFVATTNLHKRYGGALATLAYYNAFKYQYGERVELALPEEYCYGNYASAISIPQRNRIITYLKCFLGRFHRYKDFFSSFLKKYSYRYQIVVLNGGFYAGDMVKMFQSYGIKVIVIHHNYEPEYHMDNRTLPTLGGLTSYFVSRNERMAYRNADLNAFLTDTDISLHQQHYGKGKCSPFLLGVFEVESQNVLPGEQRDANMNISCNFMITGSMNSVQTIRGIKDFRIKYFPIIKARCLEWKVIIAGREPDKSILKFAKENKEYVQLVANPVDIDEIIGQGTVFLCPTNVGGGMKLRLMDGLRNGLPVLVHRISARGYEMFFNQPFFQVYDGEESFKDGVVQLLNYIAEHKDYSKRICSMYRSIFSFEAGCLRVKNMLEILTGACTNKAV